MKKEDFDNSLEFWKETAKLRYEEMVACQAKIQELEHQINDMEQINLGRELHEELLCLRRDTKALERERDELRAALESIKKIPCRPISMTDAEAMLYMIECEAAKALKAQAPEEEG